MRNNEQLTRHQSYVKIVFLPRVFHKLKKKKTKLNSLNDLITFGNF